MDDLFAAHDALAVADLIRTRKLGATEVLDGTLANLHRLNKSLNAITDFYDDAPPAADGPFHGVPYVIKQLMPPPKVVSRPSPVVEPWSLRLCGPSPDITVTTLSVGAKPRCTW